MPDQSYIKVSAANDLSPYDPYGTRRAVIGEILSRSEASAAAFNALGEGEAPPIKPPAMNALLRRVSTNLLNDLARIKRATGPTHANALRDRVVIMWILHDACWQAEVAPRRIKIEQRARALVEIKASERLDSFLGQLGPLLLAAEPILGETEAAYGLKDPLRPLTGIGADIDRVRACIKALSRETPPTYPRVLGIQQRIESGALDVGDTAAIAFAAAGKQSALGLIAVLIPALIGPRQDAQIASLAAAAFDDPTFGDARLLGRRRAIFLEERGLNTTAGY